MENENSENIVVDFMKFLSYPILVIGKIEDEYSKLYSNLAMDTLLDTDSDLEKLTLDEALLDVLNIYEEQNDEQYIIQNVKIFDNFYTLNLTKTHDGIFIMFSQTDDKEQFHNIMFQEISELCSVIIIIFNAEGKIIDVNDCFLNFVGMTKKEVLLKNFFESFIPGDINTLSKYFKEILSQDTHHQHFVTPMNGIDKKYRINWQISKIIKNSESYIVAVGSDVSKFLDENSDLKRQITSIKVGFNLFPFSVGYFNSQGVFIKMNSRFKKMFQIEESKEKILFDDIKPFKENIGFNVMKEHIQLIKEVSYKIIVNIAQKPVKLKIDIRMLSGKKESSKFYILVAQKISK